MEIYIISFKFFLNHLRISCRDCDPSPKYFSVSPKNNNLLY